MSNLTKINYDYNINHAQEIHKTTKKDIDDMKYIKVRIQ